MAATPEHEYNVSGSLNDPFSALNRAEKEKKEEIIRKQKEQEKKELEAKIKAEKDARKEEARKLKEQELAETIKKRTVDTETSHQKEEARKAAELAAQDVVRLEQEKRQQALQAEADRKQKAEDDARKKQREDEEAEAKKKIADEKAAMRERRERELREEEQLAEKRATEIAEARELEKKIEEAKKQGKVPGNFIPMIWGSSADRKELERLLERPYWEQAVPPQEPARSKTDFTPQVSQEVVKSSFRSEDTWLEEKRLKQATVPWSYQVMKSVADPDTEMTAAAFARQPEEDTGGLSLVEKYHKIVATGRSAPQPDFRSSQPMPDQSLMATSFAKTQAAALWAAVERGEIDPNAPRPMPGSADEVVELVQALAKSPDGLYGRKPGQEAMYGKKPPPAESAYGKKTTPEDPYGKKPGSLESPYGKKATPENSYGKKPNPESPYGKKSAESPYGKKPPGPESSYGKKVQDETYSTVTQLNTAIASKATESAYGRKEDVAVAEEMRQFASAAKDANYGSRPQQDEPHYGSKTHTESPYGTKPPKTTGAYGSKAKLVGEGVYGSKTTIKAAAGEPEEPIYGQTIERANTGGEYSTFKSDGPAAPARPSVASLSQDQIIAMVNAMTPQQQQQAYMMLTVAVGKGTTLTTQQQQLLTFLEQRASGIEVAPPGRTSFEQAEGKKGLFFNLPKKQKFNFGIPGREMITLRQFERISDKKGATEKALMIICNDIAFLCHQTPGDSASTYELYDKPTQRDQVKAEEYGKDEKGFVLKLAKASHTLLANSKEEKQYWIQVINARANFIPTDRLTEKAGATATS